MQNLSVSIRIIGGYAFVVVMAAAIAISGYTGISSMSQSFDKVTQQALPMIDQSNLLVTHTLLAQRKLHDFEKSKRLADLETIESEFNGLVDNNSKVSKRLAALITNQPELGKTFKDAQTAGSKFHEAGKELIAKHREAVQKSEVVATQRMQFGDMGDETLSFAYDIEGSASDDGTFEKLTELQSVVELAVSSVYDALRSGIKPAVLEAKSDLNSSFNDIASLISQLENASDVRGHEGFAGIKDAFQQQKVASENLLNAYLDQLNSDSQAKDAFSQAQQATDDTVMALAKLVDGVNASTENIKQQASDVTDNSKISLIVFALIALIVSIVVAMFITRSIREPLTQIVEKIKVLATGDLRQDFKDDRKDELGQLAQSMHELVSQLTSMLSSVSSNSEQLAATAEQSSSISRQTFDNVDRQKEQTDQMVTSVNEMTATVAEVSSSANQTLSEVESAYNEMTNGESVLKHNIERFQQLSEDIKNGANVIQDLNDDSKNIGGVLDVIKGIAEQTNLLALNAAIEAARAGEQGRGFAVVADEVRSLASRSQDSTAEIEDMIVRLQSRAQEAVSVMESSEKEAQHSVESISEAGTTLQRVTGAISTIKDMSYQIASAAEEQAAASQSQLEAITLIANAAEENATGSQENLAASEELAQMAEKQRTLVGQFKL